MTLTERNTSRDEDARRLDYLIAELRAIDEEIRGEIDDFRHDIPMKPDYGGYSRRRRARIDRLVNEVNLLAAKYLGFVRMSPSG